MAQIERVLVLRVNVCNLLNVSMSCNFACRQNFTIITADGKIPQNTFHTKRE